MKNVPAETDFVVVGAGVAGMRAAIELASAGQVLVLAKLELTESATQYAQGGIAAALSDEDEIGLHLQDTLNAGDGLCNVDAARVLVEEGPERIEELIAWGTQFDRAGTKLAFTREGAHSRNRILHAHGDSTGQEIARALYFKAKSLHNVAFCEFEFATDLLLENGQVAGLTLLTEKGVPHPVLASAVLLATGGLGHVYRETTNPAVATGDGVGMAYRVGAEISDMEFVQFHPTALYLKAAARFLLSEALRGEGAYLRNEAMVRFMPKYHPMAELAPRDVVARAIAHELEVSRSKDPVVYLDLTHKNGEALKKRFPRIYQTCLQYNIDITTDLIPVRPAAHYAMGGVRTDLDGRTSLPRLFAAGEVACTGVHGANRLASNSLLEGLVYGARAGHSMQEQVKPASHATSEGSTGKPPAESAAVTNQPQSGKAAEEVIRHVQEIMWRDVGIVRSGDGLKKAISQLDHLRACLPRENTRRAHEAQNILQTGLLIARSALVREESRGAHYRIDFPSPNDARFKKHSIVQNDKIRFE
ncbi:MAG TPA: L-aspartate oxidase [Terriglobales bacterium]|nr:L-aspartate oxidase [Terriglobales bacterium]